MITYLYSLTLKPVLEEDNLHPANLDLSDDLDQTFALMHSMREVETFRPLH